MHLIALGLFFALFISYISTIDNNKIILFDNQFSYQCSYKQKTGQDCGSCGLSRSWVSLAKFNISEGKKYNNNGFITFYSAHIYIIGYIFIYFRKKRKTTATLLKILLITVLLIAWIKIAMINTSLGMLDFYFQ